MIFLRMCFAVALAGLMTACGGGSQHDSPMPPPLVATPVTLPMAEVRILVVGQSIASNCNEFVYAPIDGVYQIDRSGEVTPARDPFQWADCTKGAVWMPLGKLLIDSGVAKKVVFMPIGVAGSKVEDWLAGGAAFQKLNAALELVNKKGITFNLAVWHQGSANAGDSQAAYSKKLTEVLDYVNSKSTVDRWLIAIHSVCFGTYDRNVEAAQIELGNMRSLRYYPGANNNTLGEEYRTDRCHLNKAGQEKLATLWLGSIQAALK